jgi:hypothetical protein
VLVWVVLLGVEGRGGDVRLRTPWRFECEVTQIMGIGCGLFPILVWYW